MQEVSLQQEIPKDLNHWLKLRALTLGISKKELITSVLQEYRDTVNKENESESTAD